MRCPEYSPGNGEGVIEDSQKDAKAESSDQKSGEKGVQGGDVE